MPYISEEKMFVRERYSLVAAIVTMIILGVWGICVVEGIDNLNPPYWKQTRTYEVERR
jgi:hypothetical protein